MVCGVVRDAAALFCERVTVLDLDDGLERVPFPAEPFVVERPAVFRRSKLFALDPFVALLAEPLDELLAVLRDVVPVVPRVALRSLSVREATFREPLNSPGLAVAVTAGRPWFTDAN